MTHEVGTIDDAPRPSRTPMTAGGRPQAIIPQTMDDAYRLGKAICLAGMAPKGMDTPEKCMIAIMRGMEVGLTPMQALDKIAIVNGRPTIWGDGALGLVRGSGLCQWVRERIEGADEAMMAVCETQRRGEPEPISRTFSVADAKKAGLWGKSGPWQQFPTRMLAMRARAFCLRDGFADVLGGLYLKEELDNGEPEPQQRRAPSPGPALQVEHRPAEPASIERQAEPQQQASELRRAPSPTAAPQQQAKPAEAVQRPSRPDQQDPGRYDPEKVRKAFAEAAKAASDRDALNAAWDRHVDPWTDSDLILPPDRDDLDRLYSERARELDEAGR